MANEVVIAFEAMYDRITTATGKKKAGEVLKSVGVVDGGVKLANVIHEKVDGRGNFLARRIGTNFAHKIINVYSHKLNN
jgi:hypothetical protein